MSRDRKLLSVIVQVIHRTLLEAFNLAEDVPISTEELDLFLKFQNDIGAILYFSIDLLKDKIVLVPQWMIDVLKSLITAKMFVLRNAPAVSEKWDMFNKSGQLSQELIDAIWTKEKYPYLHDNKEHILLLMEHLNIIARPRCFSEDGSEMKVENYFLAPCMLKETTPNEVMFPKSDPEMKSSSSVLCYNFIDKFLPSAIFHRLLATCVSRWPIAKRMSENQIFCGCCIFSLDLHHRLTVLFREYVIFVHVIRFGTTEMTPSSKLCIEVQEFITKNLTSIIGYLGRALKFEMSVQCPQSVGYRVDCLIPLTDLQGNADVPCHFHDESHVIRSQDVLKFWFHEEEQSDEGWSLENLRVQGAPEESQKGKLKADIDQTEAMFTHKMLAELAKSVGIIQTYCGSGTGFRVGPNYVMTARHVVEKIMGKNPRLQHHQPQSFAQYQLCDIHAHINFCYERNNLPSDPNHIYFFEPEIEYESVDLDTVILKLKPNTMEYPPALTKFDDGSRFIQDKSVGYFIGHSQSLIKKTDKYQIVTLTQSDIDKAKEWSMKRENLNGYDGIENQQRILFHCSFEKGASGSPGFWFNQCDGEAYVELMLVCGYPTWIYDKYQGNTIGIPNSCLVEQGISMKSVYDDMKARNSLLCKTVFETR
ncbi:hypothetical protein ACJMK2_013801 [Sinanodonta woodiana]|uniref:COR domain-containing protein n=1 Tax=Sinanodonta woodiana TaxID=1069815 RepID=A0ABD3V0K8_SINWO